ncbi:hypothetical protein Ais01nite_16690 [Asanoa ishikariensis]|nr:hypothetical protein Ais01nite_16690 [Asanoa ishikariensis]
MRASITVGARDGSTSVIQLRLQAPTDWNRRYVQLGGGGFCGSIPTAGTSGSANVDLGYAVASDDTGHVGGGSDASFALDNTAVQSTWGLPLRAPDGARVQDDPQRTDPAVSRVRVLRRVLHRRAAGADRGAALARRLRRHSGGRTGQPAELPGHPLAGRA